MRANIENTSAYVEVSEDELSLAIGKDGQNVRLAAKLTGWKVDIKGAEGTVREKKEKEDLQSPRSGGLKPKTKAKSAKEEGKKEGKKKSGKEESKKTATKSKSKKSKKNIEKKTEDGK